MNVANRSVSPMEGAVVALALALTGCASVRQSQADRASRPVGDPIESAKAALRAFSEAEDIAKGSEVLTNHTAAALGAMIAVTLGARLAHDTAIANELDAVLERYGLDLQNILTDHAAYGAVEGHGREFLVEVGRLLERVSGSDAHGTALSGVDLDAEMHNLHFDVVDPSTVRVWHVDAPHDVIEVRFEDGRWLIHFGDLSELKQKLGWTPDG